jgi:hypothetical protein
MGLTVKKLVGLDDDGVGLFSWASDTIQHNSQLRSDSVKTDDIMKIPQSSGIDLSQRIKELIELDRIKYENYSTNINSNIE